MDEESRRGRGAQELWASVLSFVAPPRGDHASIGVSDRAPAHVRTLLGVPASHFAANHDHDPLFRDDFRRAPQKNQVKHRRPWYLDLPSFILGVERPRLLAFHALFMHAPRTPNDHLQDLLPRACLQVRASEMV